MFSSRVLKWELRLVQGLFLFQGDLVNVAKNEIKDIGVDICYAAIPIIKDGEIKLVIVTFAC